MQPEQRLFSCIEALAKGLSIEECLALHPEHVEELAPLLQLALSLQEQQKPQLSSDAFQRGRQRVAKAAQAAEIARLAVMPVQGRHRRFIPTHTLFRRAASRTNLITTSQNGHQIDGAYIRDRRHRHIIRNGRPTSARKTVASRRALQLTSSVLVILLLFGTATVLRQVVLSPPGSILYEIKSAGEHAQGLLMTAAGEGATWHANQTLRRLNELAQFTAENASGQPDDNTLTLRAMLINEIERHTQQALVAGLELAENEKQRFFDWWLTRLAMIEDDLQGANIAEQVALEELQRASTRILAETTLLDPVLEPTSDPVMDQNIEILDSERLQEEDDTSPILISTNTPTAEGILGISTVVATNTTKSYLVATATPIKANSLLDRAALPINAQRTTATRVLRATSIPTATPMQIVRVTVTSTPTHTPLPVITRVMPVESTTDESNRGENQEKRDHNKDNGTGNQTIPEPKPDNVGTSDPANRNPRTEPNGEVSTEGQIDNDNSAGAPNGDEQDGIVDEIQPIDEPEELPQAINPDEASPIATSASATATPIRQKATATSDVPLLPTVVIPTAPTPVPALTPSSESTPDTVATIVVPESTVTDVPQQTPSSQIPDATADLDPTIETTEDPTTNMPLDTTEQGHTPEAAISEVTPTAEHQPTRIPTRRPTATAVAPEKVDPPIRATNPTAEPTDSLTP